MMKRLGIWLVLGVFVIEAYAQRQYANTSVLSTGNWYTIAVKDPGVYKVDAAFLAALGLGSNIPSASIRLFGNGGAMLGELGNADYVDDLFENAIEVVDGGDGVFGGSDYFLFYAPGSSVWVKDSLQQSFRFRKNLYSDSAYYYLSVGGTGKRIREQNLYATATTSVSLFDERYVLENDLVNLIGSGKEWYGEKFAAGNLSKSFSINWPGLVVQQPLRLTASFASRNVGAPAKMVATVNGLPGTALNFPSVTGTFLDRYAIHLEQSQSFNQVQDATVIRFDYESTASGAECWLNQFELLGRRALAMLGNNTLFFRDWNSVSAHAVARFDISNALAGLNVWDITHPLEAESMRNISGSGFSFHQDASRLREYVAFYPTLAMAPTPIGKIANQNLHGIPVPEYLIISPASFLPAAQQLAAFHRSHYQRSVQVVNVEQVFHEFGSGIADPSAIRDFVKMLYDKGSGRLKFLLLFGSGSYDPKNRVPANFRFIPTYQSPQSLDPITSFTSDDFFGLLDDSDDINQLTALQTLDVAVGRIPARSVVEAERMVQKIIRYHDASRRGDWRNQLLMVADDKDLNLHLQDAEAVSSVSSFPLFNIQKVYLDAFPLVSGSGGARYPAVNEQLVNRMNQGALIVNYSGHGNHIRLADEAVFTIDEVNRLNNAYTLPLMVTASCDFYPFDAPSKHAIGSQMLTGDSTGAIALLTTARLVLAASNRIINEYFFQSALQKHPVTGTYLSLGEAVRSAKNLAVMQAGEVLNTRKFLLLGDPAMQLSFPVNQVQLLKVNGLPATLADTLRASATYELEGQVLDPTGQLLTGFHGQMVAVVYDKARSVQTLGNDPSSPVASYQQQSAILFKGLFSVQAGMFKINIILPKDVSFQPGKGKIHFYAFNEHTDAAGADTGLVVMGSSQVLTDRIGPQIRLFLNDTSFKNGGLSSELPVLLAYLSDSSGINTSGNGVGHDITLVMDNLVRDIRVLNDLYQADLNSWQSGSIRLVLPLQSDGAHQLRLKAWDGANNSSEALLDYVVIKEAQLAVTKVMNFPNPFTDKTRISFEHNQPAKDLQVTVFIYQSNGRLVKRLSNRVNTAGTRNIQLEWDGRDESGRKVQKAVYIYQIVVESGNQRKIHAGQLFLL